MKNSPNNSISQEVMADAELVARCVAEGKPVPPEVARRVHDRAGQIRDEIFEKHGLVDIAVPAIRELRGELPAQ